MGVVTYLLGKLIYPILFTGGATVFAFRLGSELPIAARNAGRSLGMGYNYFKVTLRVRDPALSSNNNNPTHPLTISYSSSHQSRNKRMRSSANSGRPLSKRMLSLESSNTAYRRRGRTFRRLCLNLALIHSRMKSSSYLTINRRNTILRGKMWQPPRKCRR